MHEYILITEPALTIILEHAYFLWDQDKSKDCIAPAIAHYKTSPNCHAVMQAMDAAFDAVEGDNIIDSVKALKEELIHIALRNRLCRFHSQPCNDNDLTAIVHRKC